MKIKASLARKSYDHEAAHDAPLCIELKAPRVEIEKKRPSLAIIAVVDVSGSMGGSKLGYVKLSCKKLMEHLAPGDMFGMVAFDSAVYTVAKPVEITHQQRTRIEGEIDKLNAGSCTNMSGGLLRGLEVVSKMDITEDTLKRVILFTDGHANEGVAKNRSTLLPLVEKKVTGGTTLSCMGYGHNCDQDLLSDMAAKGGGGYSFIDNPDKCLSAFGRELGGLLSTYATDVKVTIRPNKNNSVMEVLNDYDVDDDNGAPIITVGNIISEETKTIVANIVLGTVDNPLPRDVSAFKIEVSWNETSSDKAAVQEVPVKVLFCKKEDAQEDDDKTVVKEKEVLEAANAIELANRAAEQGDYTRARELIRRARVATSNPLVASFLGNTASSYDNAAVYSCSTGDLSTSKSQLRGRHVGGQSRGSASAMADLGKETTNATMDEVERGFTNGNSLNDVAGSLDNSGVLPVLPVDPPKDEPSTKPKSKLKKKGSQRW